MSDQVYQIAMRLKEMREISGLSVEEVASKCSITVEELEGFEQAAQDTPIGLLCELADIYRVDLSAILTGTQPKLHIYQLVRKGKGVHVDRNEKYSYQNLAFNFGHKIAEPSYVTVSPVDDGTALSLNAHPGQEFDYVLQGTLMIQIDDKQLVLNEGDSLYFDSSHPHGMKAVGDVPAHFLAIVL